MTEEDIELLLEKGISTYFHPGGTGCCGIQTKDEHMVCLFGWQIQGFYTAQGAEKFRQLLKEHARKNIKRILSGEPIGQIDESVRTESD